MPDTELDRRRARSAPPPRPAPRSTLLADLPPLFLPEEVAEQLRLNTKTITTNGKAYGGFQLPNGQWRFPGCESCRARAAMVIVTTAPGTPPFRVCDLCAPEQVSA